MNFRLPDFGDSRGFFMAERIFCLASASLASGESSVGKCISSIGNLRAGAKAFAAEFVIPGHEV